MRLRKPVRIGQALLLVLFAGLLTSQATAGPQPVDRPLIISASEGLFAVTFPEEEAVGALSISKKGQKRAVKVLNRWVADVVSRSMGSELPVEKPARAQKRLAKLISSLLNRQQSAREDPFGFTASVPRLNALTVAAGVTVVGMTLDETLDVEFTLDGGAYFAALDNRATYAAGEGAVLQIDFSSPPARGELDGSLFVALVRETSAPGLGLLVVGVFDSALPDILSELGAPNSTESALAVTIPYELQLTGSTSGVHDAELPSFDALYYAREDVLGVGVPAELAELAASLIATTQ